MASRMAGLAVALLGAGDAGAARAQALDTVSASAAIAAFDANCRAFGEHLWGRSLCGPLVLVHAPTRSALTSRPDPGASFAPVAGVYAGRLPDGLPTANTAVEWGGERWTMALLPLPTEARSRHALIAHEAFHRAQPELGFDSRDPASPHLDEEAGRVWLRLELRALALALESTTEDAMRAAHDAALFRSHRHHLYPGADTLEAMLELHEGLAEYTGTRYAMMLLGDDVARVAQATRDFESTRSFVRSFAYGTGPAIGLLLDRFSPGWRGRVRGHGMAAMLADVVAGGAAPVAGEPELRLIAVRYGYEAVAAEEADRAARLAARLEDIRRRLLGGPTLLLTQSNLSATFNPNELVPVPGAGTYYPAGSFRGPWGDVEVRDGGALVSQDWGELRLPAAGLRVEGSLVEGPGWTLELAEGWAIRARGEGWAVAR